MSKVIKENDGPIRRRAPAMTPEEREDQMIALAVDLAEKRLIKGTATSQEIIHYLKLGSTKERLEKEKLIQENELLKAKTTAVKSSAHVEELFNNAINAMRSYKGRSNDEEAPDEFID